MHNYSINNQERFNITFIIIIIAYFFTVMINSFINIIYTYITKCEKVKGLLEKLEFIGVNTNSIALIVVSLTLYWIFDNYIWKWKLIQHCISTPDFNGIWEGSYKSSFKDQKSKINYSDKAKLIIKQTWSKISITSANGKTEDEKSNSYSRALSIIPNTSKGLVIVYQYENELKKIEEEHMRNHKGYSELTYNKDKLTLEGTYVNDGINRQTYGSLIYKKVIN